jgi:hypothetical protein
VPNAAVIFFHIPIVKVYLVVKFRTAYHLTMMKQPLPGSEELLDSVKRALTGATVAASYWN